MENLAQIRYEWAEALTAETFDPDALLALRERYAAAVARHAEWSALYAEQRAIVAEERAAAREAAWEAHAQKSLSDLIAAAGYSWNPKKTKRELLEEIASLAAGRVESEHGRVARIWAERSAVGDSN
jgi:hypothetical protein